jgi:hypothetical protein
VLKNQLNDGGTRLLPKLRAVNVRVMLTHLVVHHGGSDG